MDNIEFIELIRKSESVFSNCFETLMHLKTGTLDNVQMLMDFQPNLADCLLNIMKSYQHICRCENDYIGEKNNLPENKFAELMKNAALGKEILKRLINIGKALGDGFAWFFYRESSAELKKHYAHSNNGLFVCGIGGEGELSFIKRNQIIDGFFVVYHGITSILRIGDFSLCTIDGQVVAIGELKTEKEGCSLQITAYVSSKVKVAMNGEAIDLEHGINPNPDRLLRQLKKQDDVLNVKKADYNTNKYSSQYYTDVILQAVSSKKNVAISEDKSLAIFTVPMDGDLSVILLNEQLPEKTVPHSLASEVSKILIAGSNFNEIRYSYIDLSVHSFRRPIVWWNLQANYIKDIIWGKLLVVTIFNMAHLYNGLEKAGFLLSRVSKDDEKPIYQIKKTVDKKEIEFHNTEMLVDLILHDLMNYSEIVHIMQQMIDDISNSAQTDNGKIELLINQKSF